MNRARTNRGGSPDTSSNARSPSRRRTNSNRVTAPDRARPRDRRAGPGYDEQAGRWPDVGGVLQRQPWSLLDKIIPPGIPDRQSRARDLRRFIELLLQWNRRVSNLISKNDEARIVASHLVPSLEPAAWIGSHGLARWLDFGSGGGFPAIPLAICGVGGGWDLVESRRTKTLFLRRAAGQLGLQNIRVFAERLENLAATGSRKPAGDDSQQSLAPPYDGFTSRATLALGPTLDLAAQFVRPGGCAFLWKGSKLAGELAATNFSRDWEEIERRALSNQLSVVIKFQRKNV